jgi:curved DNA-binding protein CbpA
MITRDKWDILGIEPTTDTRQIKKAYAKKLKECPPEEDPDNSRSCGKSMKLS